MKNKLSRCMIIYKSKKEKLKKLLKSNKMKSTHCYFVWPVALL
jgi:hypothetical protein